MNKGLKYVRSGMRAAFFGLLLLVSAVPCRSQSVDVSLASATNVEFTFDTFQKLMNGIFIANAITLNIEATGTQWDLYMGSVTTTPGVWDNIQYYGTSGRPEIGVPIQQTIMLGIKIPFGSDARTQAQTLTTKANQIEAEERLIYEKSRLLSELDGAKARVETSGIRRDAAIRRAKLANETRRFFEKSFKFGETDLPTRLRIEQEATDASKQAAQAEVAYLAAISSLRQALGLIPE